MSIGNCSNTTRVELGPRQNPPCSVSWNPGTAKGSYTRSLRQVPSTLLGALNKKACRLLGKRRSAAARPVEALSACPQRILVQLRDIAAYSDVCPRMRSVPWDPPSRTLQARPASVAASRTTPCEWADDVAQAWKSGKTARIRKRVRESALCHKALRRGRVFEIDRRFFRHPSSRNAGRRQFARSRCCCHR